ncbi:MAG: helix-turn-helix domain-containing protein [Gammaproteobacteria bacterium]
MPRRPQSPSKPRAKPLNKPLGDLIHKARVRAGLTQRDLAQALDAQPPFISKLENGDVRQPNAAYIEPLSEALNIPYDILYRAARGMEPPNPQARPLPVDVAAHAAWLAGLNEESRAIAMRVAHAAVDEE